MGNCSRKNNISRIPAPMHCPRCNMYFSSQTNHTVLNNHLSSCLSNLEDVNLVNSWTFSQMNTPQVLGKANSKLQTPEPFVWIKTVSTENKPVWQKQKSTGGAGEEFLETLSLKQIANLGFEDKSKWFKNGLELLRIHWTQGADYLRIDRTEILKSSLKAIQGCNLFKEVKVEFNGDEKVNDAGGLLREWMSLTIKELVNPNLGLFVRTDTEYVCYMINPKIPDNEEALELYEFAGKVVGKAIFERITLDIIFDNCLLRAIAGQQPSLDDLKFLDTPLYNSLVFLQHNTIGGSDLFQEYFVVPDRGDKVIELCHGGVQKLVTDKNKGEYIDLLVTWYGKERVQKKLSAFLNGLASCIPLETLSVFEPRELEMMINGVPFIDTDDWETYSTYKGCFNKDHKVIRWFWKIVKEMSQDDLAILLQFCTGSSRTPVEGFRALESNRGSYSMFCIESTSYKKGPALITAHTCFNRLVLPLYPDEETLKEDLYTTIRSDFNGVFGLD